MTTIPEHTRGYRDGVRAAVTWLHARAREMNDPHAVAILNSAATNLGWAMSREKWPSPVTHPTAAGIPGTGEEP